MFLAIWLFSAVTFGVVSLWYAPYRLRVWLVGLSCVLFWGAVIWCSLDEVTRPAVAEGLMGGLLTPLVECEEVDVDALGVEDYKRYLSAREGGQVFTVLLGGLTFIGWVMFALSAKDFNNQN